MCLNPLAFPSIQSRTSTIYSDAWSMRNKGNTSDTFTHRCRKLVHRTCRHSRRFRHSKHSDVHIRHSYRETHWSCKRDQDAHPAIAGRTAGTPEDTTTTTSCKDKHCQNKSFLINCACNFPNKYLLPEITLRPGQLFWSTCPN